MIKESELRANLPEQAIYRGHNNKSPTWRSQKDGDSKRTLSSSCNRFAYVQ